MSVRVGDEIVAGGQGDMYTKAQVDALIASAIAQTTEKPGMIKPFAGTTVPTGYLLCDGSAVSRTTYANLFAAIGTTYGSGDGSTTFNIPNKTPERTVIAEQSPQGVYKTWYRKYCDGWVEEGGFIPLTACNAHSTTIAGEPEFFFEQGSLDYSLVFSTIRTGAYWADVETTGFKISKSKVHFEIYNNGSAKWTGAADNGIYWRIAGYGSFYSSQQCRIIIKY